MTGRWTQYSRPTAQQQTGHDLWLTQWRRKEIVPAVIWSLIFKTETHFFTLNWACLLANLHKPVKLPRSSFNSNILYFDIQSGVFCKKKWGSSSWTKVSFLESKPQQEQQKQQEQQWSTKMVLSTDSFWRGKQDDPSVSHSWKIYQTVTLSKLRVLVSNLSVRLLVIFFC